ncbi:MAG: NTP transferase domain-containing protein [Clostridiales Family XIII bacterium]|nr:NTP transferase domain-containing protein [Clostridiales Family XIII bacterium]
MKEFVFLLRTLAEANDRTLSQRELAGRLGISLGKVNALVADATRQGLLGGDAKLTEDGRIWLDSYRVDNAIILAAGFGSRFVPFTFDTPKGLLLVNGQPMIERQIEQLHEVGINDITIVVGYLKEKFDYLIDKYGVKLIYNPEYAVKNNFVSVYYASEQLKNTYLLMADHHTEKNIFHTYEPDSYLCCTYFDGPTKEWGVTTGARGLITQIDTLGEDTWGLNGPAYFAASFSERFAAFIMDSYETPGTDDYYWEHVLAEHLKELPIYINKQSADNVREFESLEELRRYDDSYSRDTDNAVMRQIAETFGVAQSGITGIHPVKEGMTNQSFVFSVGGLSYVFRLPGKGTEQLLSRANEKRSYELIAPLDIADELVFFDGETGVKISKFYEGAGVLDAENDAELKRAMELLGRIHGAGIKAEHRFDIEELIGFYERLAQDAEAIRFTDYAEVRAKANELLAFRRRLGIPEILCHIDYIFATLLCLPDGGMRVIDWEYSGAADPIIDIAMFSIYSYFPRERADLALSYYLGRIPERQETARLYMYMALAGFLWALWCEYKQSFGEEFGEYPLVMYRYMKDYYKILHDEGFLDEAGGAK